MNTSEAHLHQCMEQLERMHAALADLRTRIAPVNPGMFAVLAEGPLDAIRQLRAEIDAATGATAALELQPELWLRVEGEGISLDEARGTTDAEEEPEDE